MFKQQLWDFSCLPTGSGGSSEGHTGVPASHRDPASSERNHRSGWGEAFGGGQPAVRLGLAGDAQPCHPEGETGHTTEAVEYSYLARSKHHIWHKNEFYRPLQNFWHPQWTTWPNQPNCAFLPNSHVPSLPSPSSSLWTLCLCALLSSFTLLIG